ncbi:hypothetical protein NQ317_016494 [Molorchus minor]|uniref:NAD(+) kinase n=1 Tax=Molorchus minor TaxID=1323400 RepID=A0ABQ9J1E8_9CUCU|nr:hypothetical protein NQ317_016494 [Molorchus minor]
MYSIQTIVKKLHFGTNIFLGVSFKMFSDEAKFIKTEKVLVVSKLSKYEHEKIRHKNLSEQELEALIRNRGTDYEKLIHHHELHNRFKENVVSTLRNMGCEVEVVNRLNYTEDKVEKADVIVPTGGDGTFLLAASKVKDNKKPVIGFNSDPNRSEGYLCLPKKYSTDIRGAIEKLQMGKFDWLMRSRIRTTLMVSEEENLTPIYLHGIDAEDSIPECSCSISGVKILPVLALNEVFMGEKLAAKVSHLQMRLNGSTQMTNLKCSGICVSTGTGSTSWHLSINRLPAQSVAELLRLIDIDATEGKDSLATILSEIYNKNLIFPPDDKRMGYTIRELISAGVWPQPKGIKPRGFATKVEVKSNCFDASLVIDGGVSFNFNDGAIALLEVFPEDALRTVVLKD